MREISKKNAIVIDNGSMLFRAGFSGEDRIRIMNCNLIGCEKYQSIMIPNKRPKEYYRKSQSWT